MIETTDKTKVEPLLVSSEMGLGHLRALYPFEELYNTQTIVLGQNSTSSSLNRFLWRKALTGYNWISRHQQLPVIGKPLFSILDSLLAIAPLSDKKIASKGSFQLGLVEYAIKAGLCDELENYSSKKIVLTSFYAPTIYFSKKHPEVKLLCQICDTDLSRVWVPRKASNNIIYLATCVQARNRLLSYGVAKNNIHITGFPFPNSLVGDINQGIAKTNFEERLVRLKMAAGKTNIKTPLRILFAIGGAGAQTGIALQAVQSLSVQILNGDIEFTLVVPPQFKHHKNLNKLKSRIFKNCEFFKVVYSNSQTSYFNSFNKAISISDVLWTKPSELSFYSALGIPIIISPPLGAQERANREWLLEMGAGVDQMRPTQTHIWINNLLMSGLLHRMAKQGWENGIRTGSYSTVDLINSLQ